MGRKRDADFEPDVLHIRDLRILPMRPLRFAVVIDHLNPYLFEHLPE
jgi:hypothetical protein